MKKYLYLPICSYLNCGISIIQQTNEMYSQMYTPMLTSFHIVYFTMESRLPDWDNL